MVPPIQCITSWLINGLYLIVSFQNVEECTFNALEFSNLDDGDIFPFDVLADGALAKHDTINIARTNNAVC